VRTHLLIAFAMTILVPLAPALAEEEREIAIGGLFDLTGGGAIWGKSEKNAFLLACKDFELKNPDVKVKPIIEDSMFSSKHTVTALQKMTSVNKIKYVVGTTWETTVPMMPLCEAKHVVCISPSYHGKEYYSRPWRYNFSAWFDDRGYSRALADAINSREHTSVAMFAAITPYYDSLVDDFISRSKASLVAQERMVLEERDFRAMISKVPKHVDAVVMLLDNAGQIQAFLKQWSELRKDRPVIYSDDLIVYLDPPEDLKKYGFEFNYSYPLFDESAQRDFLDRYTSEYKEKPEGSSASVAYDETMLLLSCVKRDHATTAVRECLAGTSDYRGVSGTFSFNGGQTVRDRVIGIKSLF